MLKSKSTLKVFISRIFGVEIYPLIFVVAVWEAYSRLSSHPSLFVSSPSAILQVARQDFVTKDFWVNVGLTAFESTSGLVIGTMFGTVFALLLWANPTIQKAIIPYVAALSSLPLVALAPLIILWFGVGLTSKVVMVSVTTFLIATAQALEGCRYASSELLDWAYAHKVSRLKVLRYIVIPSATAWVFAGLSFNCANALSIAFVGEYISSEAGLGKYIVMAGSLYDIPRLLLGLATLSGITVILLSIIRAIENRFYPWVAKMKNQLV